MNISGEFRNDVNCISMCSTHCVHEKKYLKKKIKSKKKTLGTSEECV